MPTHVAFLVLIGSVGFIRWRLLGANPYPTGIDAGNWLAYGHAMLGEHLRSASLVYPPVVPLIAVLGEWLLGTYTGLQALAFIAASAPALGTYFLLSAWCPGWRAAVLAALLAASAGTGEAMAWGGYPELIGLGILPVFVWALDRFLESRTITTGLLPAILLAAALATSDLVGPMTVLVGLIYLVGWYALLRKPQTGNSPRNIAIGIAIGVALSLPMLPTYLGLLAGVASNEHVRLLTNSSALTLGVFGTVTRDFPNFWIAALAVALVAPLILIPRRERLALLCAAILAPSIGVVILVGENRLMYFVPLGVVIGVAAALRLVERLPNWGRRSFDAALVTCVLIDVFIGTQQFNQQHAFYTVLNPGLAQGLAELEGTTEPTQVIAVSPGPHGWALGWWVEGVSRRRSFYAGDPIYLNYADEKARNAIANEIFDSANGVQASRTTASAAGASYLFIDKEWAGYGMWVTSGQSIDRNAIVYESDTVLIVRTHD